MSIAFTFPSCPALSACDDSRTLSVGSYPLLCMLTSSLSVVHCASWDGLGRMGTLVEDGRAHPAQQVRGETAPGDLLQAEEHG